jgi:hypothetical protein
MGIRVEHFPDPSAPENLITVAFNHEEDGNGENMVVARVSTDTLTWMRQEDPFALTEGSVQRLIEARPEPLPLLSQLIMEADKAFYAKRNTNSHILLISLFRTTRATGQDKSTGY